MLKTRFITHSLYDLGRRADNFRKNAKTTTTKNAQLRAHFEKVTSKL